MMFVLSYDIVKCTHTKKSNNHLKKNLFVFNYIMSKLNKIIILFNLLMVVLFSNILIRIAAF